MFMEIQGLKKSFGSGSNKVTVLKGIDFSLERGEFCVLLGPSGSGKSTLLNIIGGIDTPDRGAVIVNGEKMADMTEKTLTKYRRNHLGYVFQMYNLIPNLNVQENIEVGAYLSDKPLDVDELLHTLGIYEHQRKLPNQLSGGEKQRIALARAFLKDSNLYILDESTSNLDFATETLIFNMIYEQLADRSMLIVAHRLSTIRDCDLILVMDHGKIVERGNHEELMAKNGRYAELWNMQQGIFRKRKSEPAPQVPSAVVEEDDDGESITY